MIALFALLSGCSLFISEEELIGAVDLDGDGARGPAFGGDDCDDSDSSIHPNATDVPYDGIDSDCDGSDDFDADGDGLAAATYGGSDCDDQDVNVGDEARPWYADCDGDGVPSDVSVSSCIEPDLPLDLDPCEGAEALWTLVRAPVPDCDDRNPSIAPGLPDVFYDGIDSDCDGKNDFDADGDGYLSAGVPGATSDAHTLGLGDCDDENASIHPNATDIWYDGVDSNCDGRNDHDADGDGFVPPAFSSFAGGTAPFDGDCDDEAPAVHPGQAETPYDGVDSDCDGHNDYDADRDGSVAPEHADQAGGLALGDCDDEDARRSPLVAEVWYDGVDGDCGGENDFDQDGDGFVRAGFADQAGGSAPGVGDCADLDASVFPSAPDAPYDGVDSDCDGSDDHDLDGDGFQAASAGGPPALRDCDDGNAAVHPGAFDAPYDGVDTNCDGANDYDADGDGSVADLYALVAQLPGGDCDDSDPRRSALHPEVWYDGVDGDCDGSNDYDADGDGFVSTSYPAGADPLTPPGDCDDDDRFVNPNAPEAFYDGVDSDCDGSNDYDADGDGFVALGWHAEAGGTAPRTLDCDDGDASLNPGAPDTPYDGVDSNCDGSNDFDVDDDGVPHDLDCDDFDPGISPLAVEIPYDGIDQACDGGFDYDVDGDGYLPVGYDAFARPGDGVGDCDDFDPGIHPGAQEIWYDGVDQDCDGANDFDRDQDAYVDLQYPEEVGGSAPLAGDCDDDAPAVNPGQTDVPYDGIDSDCSGGSDADLDGDGVELLQDCTGVRCDCDDSDPSLSTGDWTILSGTALQPLIDRACAGVTLALEAGTYQSDSPLRLERAITLRGVDANQTALLSATGRVVTALGTGVRLENLDIGGGSDDDGGCLRVEGAATLSGVWLHDCAAGNNGGAVYVAPGGSLHVVDSTLELHTAMGFGAGIYAEQASLVLENTTVRDVTAGADGGAVFALDSAIAFSDLFVERSDAEQGGGLQLVGSHGSMDRVWVQDVVSRQQMGGVGADPLPSAVGIDYACRVGPLLTIEDLDVHNSSAGVGLSIYEPKGVVQAHDVVVRNAGLAFGVNLEPQGGTTSIIEVDNLLSAGAATGVRMAGFAPQSFVRLDHATAVGSSTGLFVEVFSTYVGLHNAVLQGVGSPTQGAVWSDFQSSFGGSDLSYSWVVGGSAWVLTPPSIRLNPGEQPPFCFQCFDSGSDPFTTDFHLAGGSALIGAADPNACPPGSPPSCLEPGYWGGPVPPSP